METDNWFHEQITRSEAEELLLSEREEGTFLVRNSTTGNFALSVFRNGKVEHHQIYRHQFDALFALENDIAIFGLDELIQYYRYSGSGSETNLKLTKPIISGPPPAECRRRGKTRLIHRATDEGALGIVRECVLRAPTVVDARNEDGRTPLHLSCIKGSSEMVMFLIQRNANVNVKDSFGYTPLHYACRSNFPRIAKMLLENEANPQIRGEKGWVALHEAAAKGSIECVKILHKLGAPLKPRTAANELPIDISREFNMDEVTTFLDEATVTTRSCRNEWYHEVMSRQEAIEDLMNAYEKASPENKDKFFYLIRRSTKDGSYVLTMLQNGQDFNFILQKYAGMFHIDDGPYLNSLEHVVDHYSRWIDGLPGLLEIPVDRYTYSNFGRRFSEFNQNSLGNAESPEPPPLPKRSPRPGQCPSSMQLNRNESIAFRDDKEEMFVKECDDFAENIPRKLIAFEVKLGEGEYGSVFQGTINHSDGRKEHVAIKTLKDEELNRESAVVEFRQEAKVMMKLRHENIVRIIGICWTPHVYMVQELMSLGSLQDYLQAHVGDIDVNFDMPNWAYQISKGMAYLEEKRFIHRDLAARNILLDSPTVAKISDFGLSRALQQGSDLYEASQGGRWPIRWYALESCLYGNFTHQSDVWSFGVTLWEIYSYGEKPYGEISGQQVIEMVNDGERLGHPDVASDDIYEIMRKCWEVQPEERPKFKDLVDFFGEKILKDNDVTKETEL